MHVQGRGAVRLGGFAWAGSPARPGGRGTAGPVRRGPVRARCFGGRAAAGPVRLALICSHGSNGAHARMVCGMVRDMVRGRTVRGPRFVRHGK